MKRRIPMTDQESFELANKAFELFTLDEREKALTHFASLRYPSIVARFFDAVDYVIRDSQQLVERSNAD